VDDTQAAAGYGHVIVLLLDTSKTEGSPSPLDGIVGDQEERGSQSDNQFWKQWDVFDTPFYDQESAHSTVTWSLPTPNLAKTIGTNDTNL